MKKSIVFVSAVIALVSAASCTKELIDPLEMDQVEKVTFTLSLGGEASKTALQGGKTVWAENDTILVSDGKTSQKVGIPAEFVGKQDAEIHVDPTKISTDTLCAVYPVDAFVSYTKGGAINVNVSNDQSGLFEQANVCVAVSDKYQFALKNATSVMKITIPEGIETIMLTASAADTLAGKIAVTYGDQLTVKASSPLKSIKVPTGGLEGDYYVAVVPGTYKEFTLMALTLDGKSQKKSTTGERTLAVNELASLGTIGDDLSGVALTGSGTEADPFQMKDLADITTLATMVSNGLSYDGQVVRLENDIENVTLPIGTFDQVPIAFCGTFDGNNKTITLAMGGEESEDNYLGLFGCIGAGAVVKDLNIAGTVATKGYYVGGLAAYSRVGNKETKITNVINKATVTGSNVVGGLLGYVAADVANVLSINNCKNQGIVTSTGYTAGGIAGYALYANIENCENAGTVESKTSNGPVYSLPQGSYLYSDLDGTNTSNSGAMLRGTAGILGVGYNSNVKNSNNNGPVTGVQKVGGIVGITYWTGITECKNLAPVEASADVCGGIAGIQWNNGTINKCTNEATITARAGVGGIVGVSNGQERSSNAYLDIFNSTNNGKVVSTGKVNLSEYKYGFPNSSAAGGIVGIHRAFNRDFLRIGGCINNGEVTGEGQAVGGILGYFGCPRNGADQGYIDNCVNNGKVYCGLYRVGGIVGVLFDRFTTARMVVRNCTNKGTVTGPAVVAGITGWSCTAYPAKATDPKIKVYNCLNLGNVEYTNADTEKPYVGAIAGYFNQTDYQNCWSSAAIVAPADNKANDTCIGVLFGQANAYNAASYIYADYEETAYNKIKTAEGVVSGVLYGSGKAASSTYANIAMINLEGLFDTDITVNGTSCSDPLTALNAWVGTSTTYKKWAQADDGSIKFE